MKSILLIKTFLGLAEMTFGLVYAGLSLPEWQAVKITFFALCLSILMDRKQGQIFNLNKETTQGGVSGGHLLAITCIVKCSDDTTLLVKVSIKNEIDLSQEVVN